MHRPNAPPLHSGRANAAAATAAILFGASVVAVRIAVREVPPTALAFLRFGQGAAVLGAGLALFRRDLFRVAPRDLPYLALLGLIFYTIFPVTFNAGLQYLEASQAALLVATIPLWTLLLARVVTGERLKPRQVAGVALSIAGVAIVMAERGLGRVSLTGDLLLATTALCGATYNVLAKRVLARYDGVTVSFYAMLFGSLLLSPSLAGWHPASLTGETALLVVFLGVFGGALAFTLWTVALRRLSPTEVAVYINLNPIAATLLAATTLGERLTPAFVAGFVAVASGVLVVNWMPGRRVAG
ncbi:MAG TPA: DMT family transporter [Gemmatimonadaceae bacterium]|nr:DMT family transporter [Gemmatimonadaceae bacterium]